MKLSLRSFVLITPLAAICAFALALLVINWRWYRSAADIESYLLTETPLGSSEEQVMSYLRAKGLNPDAPWRGDVVPNTSYPPNTIAGSSFMHTTIARYRLPFVTSVEIFYIFDQSGRLVEIAVSKTTDAF